MIVDIISYTTVNGSEIAKVLELTYSICAMNKVQYSIPK